MLLYHCCMTDNVLSGFQACWSEHSVFTLGFSEILNLTFPIKTWGRFYRCLLNQWFAGFPRLVVRKLFCARDSRPPSEKVLSPEEKLCVKKLKIIQHFIQDFPRSAAWGDTLRPCRSATFEQPTLKRHRCFPGLNGLNTQQDKGDSKQGTAGSCALYPVEVLLPVPVLLRHHVFSCMCEHNSYTPDQH